MKSLVKQYWLYGVIILQFVLLIVSFWYLQGRLALHEKVITAEGTTINQVVEFLNKVTQQK